MATVTGLQVQLFTEYFEYDIYKAWGRLLGDKGWVQGVLPFQQRILKSNKFTMFQIFKWNGYSDARVFPFPVHVSRLELAKHMKLSSD